MSEYFSEIEQEREPNQKRPVLLTVLAVLSFIVIGYGMLGLLTSTLSGPPSPEQIDEGYQQIIQAVSDLRDQNAVGLADFFEGLANMIAYEQHHFFPVMLLNAVTIITGFIGVLFMLRGRRLGFHFYIIYNLLSIGGVYLIVPFELVPTILLITSLILSGLFVFLYSLNLKWMNK
ncbi:MAG: hypothetical protein ACO1N0_02995 [Fluviicola sp.]